MNEIRSRPRSGKTDRPRAPVTHNVRGRLVDATQQEVSELEVEDAATGAAAPLSPLGSPQPASASELEHLHRMLGTVSPELNPRTARLLGSRTRKAAQKVIEEAGEVALEAVKHHAQGVVRESADLLYHLVVLWHHEAIDPVHIWTEMRRRADAFGLAEKLPKSRPRNSPVSHSNR
jgi:phosphoribosyl-ATP pyrophosphohydrolase